VNRGEGDLVGGFFGGVTSGGERIVRRVGEGGDLSWGTSNAINIKKWGRKGKCKLLRCVVGKKNKKKKNF